MAVVAVGAAIAITLLLWKPWGGAEQKDFSIDLETNDDFQSAARLMQEFLPDFNCTGSWDEKAQEGVLLCEAGLAGFGCEFKYPHPTVVCKQGEQLPEGFPVCTVEGSERVRCSGPKTNAFCRVRYRSAFVVTCQKA
jgi:hypothetical protein